MRKKIIFLGLVVSIFNLSSCSTILIKPEGPIGGVNYRVTGENHSEKKKRTFTLVIPKLRLYFWLLYALRRTYQLLHESRNSRKIWHEIYYDEKKGPLLTTKVPTILL